MDVSGWTGVLMSLCTHVRERERVTCFPARVCVCNEGVWVILVLEVEWKGVIESTVRGSGRHLSGCTMSCFPSKVGCRSLLDSGSQNVVVP